MHLARPLALTVLAAVVIAGCSTTSRHPARTSAPVPTTGTHVAARAQRPILTSAPGIQFTTGSLSVTMYNHTFDIAARDWNTIIGTSIVPQDIGVSLDSDFHAAQTTRNRFQYLADRMVPFITRSFGAIGIVSIAKGRTDVTIVAFINPTNNAFLLSGFSETIIESPPTTTVASAKFYTTASTALTIPGHNIYFVRLSSPVVAPPPSNSTRIAFNFGWDRLHNCGQAACP